MSSADIPGSTGVEQKAVPPKARDRHAELSELVEEHRWKYYMAQATISDAEFDKLMRELEELEDEYPSCGRRTRRPSRSAARSRRLFTPVQHLSGC